MPKTCEKQFYKNVRVVLSTKNQLFDKKKHQIFEKKLEMDFENLRPSCPKKATVLKSQRMQRLYIAFAKWSVWVKN